MEGIVIKDVGVSPYALKRKDLVELLIIKDKENTHFTTIKNISRLLQGSKYDKGLYYCKKCHFSLKSEEKLNYAHIHLCTNVKNVLTIMPEKNKNDTVKFRDYHMQKMKPFMIIADFEKNTNKLNQIKPYSFAIFTHSIFNINNNELTYFIGKDCLDEFFDHLVQHVNNIHKFKAKPSPHSNPNVHKKNLENAICLTCNNQILTDNLHAYRYYCKKKGYLHEFREGESHEQKLEITVYFTTVRSFILD